MSVQALVLLRQVKLIGTPIQARRTAKLAPS